MDQLLISSPQEEVRDVRKTAYENRRWHIEFLAEWFDFAVTNDCVSSRHTKELYSFFCKTIHSIDEESRHKIFGAVLGKVKEIIYNTPHEGCVFTEQPYVSCIIDKTAKKGENIDLMFYEHGLVVISSENLPFPLYFKKYVVSCIKALFTVYVLRGEAVQNLDICVTMEAVYIKILKKRSEKISTLSCDVMFSSNRLTRQCYLSLAKFLSYEFSTLSIEGLCGFVSCMDRYFNYNTVGQQLCLTSRSVYDLAKLMYKTHGGVEVLKDGSLIRFFTDALGGEQRAETHKQGEVCLLRIFCLYLKFCITHKITLRNHGFARWVLSLCDNDPIGPMFKTLP